MRVIISEYDDTNRTQIGINTESPRLKALCRRIGYSDSAQVINILISMGLLKRSGVVDMNMYPSPRIWVELTDSGRSYFERRADEKRELLMNSIVVPIIVAIITSAITVYILPSLGKQAEKWLKPQQTQTEESSQETSTEDALSEDQ